MNSVVAGGVFIVIFVGIFLACVTLAIEYCYFKFRRQPDSDEMVTRVDSNQSERNRMVGYNISQLKCGRERNWSPGDTVIHHDYFYLAAQEEVYGKNLKQPYVLDRNNQIKDQYTGEFGYYGAKREAELE